ncbi:MAG TPA: hypothetical protein VNX25_08625 [Verrucomicrobiae bacterium]|nr:hypothetical protein [Verrucomicrobiae bacterium]
MSGYPYLALVAAGIAAAWWGLPAAHRLQPPRDVLAALVFLAGVCAFLVGLLLTVVPDFFVS